MTKKAAKPPSPTRDEHFPQIDATPEQLAQALMRMKPRKRDEWEYMKETNNPHLSPASREAWASFAIIP